ncbi:hypothetical protein B0I35DRAFT_441135, partial [Stachybotrys elegans]
MLAHTSRLDSLCYLLFCLSCLGFLTGSPIHPLGFLAEAVAFETDPDTLGAHRSFLVTLLLAKTTRPASIGATSLDVHGEQRKRHRKKGC